MYNTRCRSLKASNNVLECKVVLVVTAASGTAGAKVPPDFRHQLAESLRPVRSVEAGRAGRARRLTDQLVQLRLEQTDKDDEQRQTEPHLEFGQSVLTDDDKCLLLPAVAVDVSGVDVEPEGVNMNATVLVGPHEGIAGDVLHLHQGVHHGELVCDTELLVDVHIGRELCLLIQFVEEERLPEVRLLYPEELVHTAGSVCVDPAPQRGELCGVDGVWVRVEIVEKVDGLAVGVAADDDVFHVVEDAGQLEHRGLRGHTLGGHQGTAMVRSFIFILFKYFGRGDVERTSYAYSV